MPVLDVTELNVVLGVVGLFMVLFGVVSVKIKATWYLGEAFPAVLFGILAGPVVAKFLDATRWGSAMKDQQESITLESGVTRVVIGVQLVIAGFQLPSKYFSKKWLPMLICLLPLMALMWLLTTACIVLVIPKVSRLPAMVIAPTVTCTDPVLSQAVAKGPFADKFVPRPLREIISAEAASNDGFGFPFLMLATYLIRFADNAGLVGPHSKSLDSVNRTASTPRGDDIGRLGGGVGVALKNRLIETWLYYVLLSIVYGAVIGISSGFAVKHALRRKCIDTESYLLLPAGLGLFIIGTCGAIGTDDLLTCTVAGATLNWDGEYLSETLKLHDEVNKAVDVLLNFGGFMYIGTILPFNDFHQPETTGITLPLLFALGILVLLFRRIPGAFLLYKVMPGCVTNWRDALFMGYFGPIGIGAVFYVEHTKTIFPKASKLTPADEEVRNLLAAMVPVVYWLVLFSIVVHGLSIPALNAFYNFRGILPIEDDDPVEIPIRSSQIALPPNARASIHRKPVVVRSIMVHNRFSVAPAAAASSSNASTASTRWEGWEEGPTIPITKDPAPTGLDGLSTAV